MNPATHTQPLGIGALISASFRMLARHFGFLFPLAFVPALVLAILGALLAPEQLPEGFDPATDPFPAFGIGDLVMLLVSVVASFLITGIMALAALDVTLGKRHAIGEYVGQALRHLAPITGLGLAVSLGAGIGFAALLVPGLYILARYLPLVPAIVFENAGWSGLGRAQDLTEGYRWPLVGALLAMGAIGVAILFLLSPVLFAASNSFVILVLADAVLSGLYYALAAIFTALVYVRLREIREGTTAEAIGASID
jgi:hypothetical protein